MSEIARAGATRSLKRRQGSSVGETPDHARREQADNTSPQRIGGKLSLTMFWKMIDGD